MVRNSDKRDGKRIEFLFYLFKDLGPKDIHCLLDKSVRFFNEQINKIKIKKKSYGLYEYNDDFEIMNDWKFFQLYNIPNIVPKKYKDLFWHYRTYKNVSTQKRKEYKEYNFIYDINTQNLLNNENSDILRHICLSIHKKQSLKISYFSKYGLIDRIISPIKLINTGDRIHVRSYDHTKSKFRDYVIGRIQTVEKTDIDFIDTKDEEWEQNETIVFHINSLLTDNEKQSLRYEYKANNNVLTIKSNKALKQYVIRNMLKMRNRDGIDIWLYNEE